MRLVLRLGALERLASFAHEGLLHLLGLGVAQLLLRGHALDRLVALEQLLLQLGLGLAQLLLRGFV